MPVVLSTAGLLAVVVLMSALATVPSREFDALLAPDARFGVSSDVVLMQSQVDALPLGTQWSSILRFTLAPGAALKLGQKRYDDDGPMLFQVASGSLTIVAEQPIRITPAGASAARTLLPGTELVLQPGSQGYSPAGVLSTWRNGGQDPVEVLQVRFSLVGFEGSCVPPPPGVSIAPLAEQRKWEQPAEPMVVTVRQVTLDARAVVPIETEPGLELLYVDSGKLSVHDPPRSSEPSNPLVPSLDGAGHPIDMGSAAKGTFRPGRILRSGAEDGAVLLLMTVAPAEFIANTAELTLRPHLGLGPRQFLAINRIDLEGWRPGATRLPSPLLDGAASCI